jgi:nicotinamidase-related amidase
VQNASKRALVIIDPQNDFCDQRGSLYVEGAAADVRRLSAHIANSGGEYTDIFISLDSHDIAAIFHPAFWTDGDGNRPAPFTQISSGGFASGRWRVASASNEKQAERTFAAMKKAGVDAVTVWPEHCVVSTWGHQIADGLRDSLRVWRERTGRAARYVFKGENPFTDQFSIFEGLDASWPETAFNEVLFARLADCESVTFTGEALSHCVEASILSFTRRLGDKRPLLRLLKDCSSPVSGFDPKASFDRIAASGVELAESGA